MRTDVIIQSKIETKLKSENDFSHQQHAKQFDCQAFDFIIILNKFLLFC